MEATDPTCVVVRPGERAPSRQGLENFAGISAESAGARGICMHVIEIPPGGRAHPHLHESHETALYIVSGRVGMWFGPELGEYLEVGAGDFLYIPADMPHLPYNPSATETCVALIARTDPNEQESVVVLPHLDGIATIPHAS